jgi:hypothetical protein
MATVYLIENRSGGTYLASTNVPLDYRLKQHNGLNDIKPLGYVDEWSYTCFINGFTSTDFISFQMSWRNININGMIDGIVENTVRSRFINLVDLLNTLNTSDSLTLHLCTSESVEEWTKASKGASWSFLTVSDESPPIPDGLY